MNQLMKTMTLKINKNYDNTLIGDCNKNMNEDETRDER